MDRKRKGDIANIAVISAAVTTLTCLIIGAKRKPKPTPTPTPTGTANLSGTVSDSTGPVSGATVLVGSLQTTTNANGQYSLKLLAIGSQGIVIKKTGYNTFSAALNLVKGNNMENAHLTPVGPTPAPTGNVFGVVTDLSTHHPIAGATVYLESGVLQTTTDGSGAFAFSDVAPGVYDFSTVKSGYSPLSYNVTIIAGSNELNVQLAPLPVVTTGLIINTVNMPDIIWSGQLTDLSNGQVQSWGVQNVHEAVNLNATNGKQVLLEYQVGSALNYDEYTAGPFLITLPSTSGSFIWDGTAFTLGGVAAVNLPATNNRQTLTGTVTTVFTPPVGQTAMTMTITGSTPNGSSTNVGQYFIGRNVTIYNTGISSALVGKVTSVDCHLGSWDLLGNGTLMVSGFIAENSGTVVVQRPYPDAAYQFSGSLSYNSVWVPYPGYPEYGTWVITMTLSVSGTVSPFAIMLLDIGYNAGSVMVLDTLQGSVSNQSIQLGAISGDTVRFSLYANPNPNAAATTAPNMDVNGWVHVADCPYGQG